MSPKTGEMWVCEGRIDCPSPWTPPSCLSYWQAIARQHLGSFCPQLAYAQGLENLPESRPPKPLPVWVLPPLWEPNAGQAYHLEHQGSGPNAPPACPCLPLKNGADHWIPFRAAIFPHLSAEASAPPDSSQASAVWDLDRYTRPLRIAAISLRTYRRTVSTCNHVPGRSSHRRPLRLPG